MKKLTDVQAAELWSEDLEEEVGGLLPPAPHAGLPALHQQPLQQGVPARQANKFKNEEQTSEI